jgi:hypothetical protein
MSIHGLSEYGVVEAASSDRETSSKVRIAVARVPPDMPPPLILMAVTELSTDASGPRADFTVAFERNAEISEGIESKPHEGMMIAPVLVA